jgi:tetratricopeptide (TPR) repeat protein
MRFKISKRTKWKLANKVTYNVFLRLLIFKPWFRVSFAAFVLLLLFLALFLPKIWRTSPVGMVPVVKVSGLDKVQAWSLKRTARHDGAGGHPDRAHYAWLGAVLHNPADSVGVRGLLTNLLSHPAVEPDSLRLALGYTFWLLHLTGTNNADLELVADVLEDYHYNDLVLSLLSPVADHFTPRQQAAFLKALFRQNQVAEFAARWQQVQGARLPDPELPLYWAAYEAGWGRVEDAELGRQKLAAALADPARRVLANRLQLAVCSRLADINGYETCLGRLQEWDQDTATDHAEYWRLLANNGRAEDAKRFARAYTKPPGSSRHLLALAEAYVGLGLRDLAQRCFQSAPSHFFGSEEVWMKYGEFLVQDRNWDDLRTAAVQMRTRDRANQEFIGYTYFLEGWAEHELGRLSPADEAFRRMNQNWIRGNARLALVTATQLVTLGRAASAWELLSKFEEELNNRPEYWTTVYDAANQLKDADLLLKAGKREYELVPSEPTAVSHYAAALLVKRQEPELAVKLTMQALATYPASAVARINHSLALLLNKRPADARSVLAGLRPNLLTPEAAASFHMVSFLISCELGDHGEAWRVVDKIDPTYLFPSDLAWIEEFRKKLPPRVQAKL